MTARLVYEAVLIELNKENAPNILLEDFNYFFNKAVYQYTNKRYNIYDINQQTTDDLRVLKATVILDVDNKKGRKFDEYDGKYSVGSPGHELSFMGATYEFLLPPDYYHILNCICIYKVKSTFKCYNEGDYWRRPATRLTSDLYSLVVDNYWLRPTYRRPYYFIHNVNKNAEMTTNPYENIIVGNQRFGTTDVDGEHYDLVNDHTDSNISPYLTKLGLPLANLDKYSTSNLVEKAAGVRYGNASQVRLEVRYGSDTSLFELKSVLIDYLKTPQHIRLTQIQIDRTLDTSLVLEFPDYVCQEIINELVHIIMENISDGKLQTHPVVSLSIANPAQQLTEPVAQQLS